MYIWMCVCMNVCMNEKYMCARVWRFLVLGPTFPPVVARVVYGVEMDLGVVSPVLPAMHCLWWPRVQKEDYSQWRRAVRCCSSCFERKKRRSFLSICLCWFILAFRSWIISHDGEFGGRGSWIIGRTNAVRGNASWRVCGHKPAVASSLVHGPHPRGCLQSVVGQDVEIHVCVLNSSA